MAFGLHDVEQAAERLIGVAHRTPVHTSRTLDARIGGRAHLKAEVFQRGGSFKFRGAYNRIALLAPEERARGVCAISSGNHAQAVAVAAAEFGVPAVILMPTDAPAVKLAATRGYGAEVVLYDRYAVPQHEAGERLRRERGLTFIESHDHPHIAAGAGTAALELLDEVGDLDVLVVPIGGGGLMAGCATVAKARRPGMRVVGVEASASGVAKRSLAAGERQRIDIPRTIADGQQLTTPGAFTFTVMLRLVDEVVLVDDDEMVDAMAFLFDRTKLVVEPSGAAAAAALLAGKVDVEGERVGVLVSGGNVGVDRFGGLLQA